MHRCMAAIYCRYRIANKYEPSPHFVTEMLANAMLSLSGKLYGSFREYGNGKYYAVFVLR